MSHSPRGFCESSSDSDSVSSSKGELEVLREGVEGVWGHEEWAGDGSPGRVSPLSGGAQWDECREADTPFLSRMLLTHIHYTLTHCLVVDFKHQTLNVMCYEMEWQYLYE